jgi:DNA-binding NarL/FixJ family response regulator
MQLVLAADTADALLRGLDGTRADVAVLDYELSRGDGLSLCLRIKERVIAPGVVVYSAHAGPALALAARLGGADALVDKSAPVATLLEAIRRVAEADRVIPDVRPEFREAALARLEPEDVPVASMLLAGASPQGIAEALGTDRRDIALRTRRVLARIRPDVAADQRGPSSRGAVRPPSLIASRARAARAMTPERG